MAMKEDVFWAAVSRLFIANAIPAHSNTVSYTKTLMWKAFWAFMLTALIWS